MPFPLIPIISAVAAELIPSMAESLFGEDSNISEPIAAAAIAVASEVTGIDIKAPDDARRANEALQSDPALLVEFQRLTNEHAISILREENARWKMIYDDVANARAREIATGDTTPRILAFIVVGGFLSYCTALSIAIAFDMPGFSNATTTGLLGTILGYWGNESKQVGGYYWGSSAGSRAKDAMINDAFGGRK